MVQPLKAWGTEPLLVPHLEALACAHHDKTSNVQSPRVYANKLTTQCHLSVVKSSDIYISMSIYHCISLDRGLKLPDLKVSRTEALINAFFKMSVAKQVNHTSLPETHYRAPLQ
jgi:hypothetical protein